MTNTITDNLYIQVQNAITNGLKLLEEPEPLKLSRWSDENFYLSAESSYNEGKWETLPPQTSIMDCMSNDDIRELTLFKSARVGFSKMMLACIAYNAEHKKRNQCIWQPVDADADEFSKSELDPMIRDVPVIKEIFPYFGKKNKYNTLGLKMFNGSTLYIRGGKSAKNYRRISLDVAYLDEIDAFDNDVDREGSPIKLAKKRLEGATFPKLIVGSTPKIKGTSLLERSFDSATYKFKYFIKCSDCKKEHALTWGGKDEKHGFKWELNDIGEAINVHHLCPHCQHSITQAGYIDVWEKGLWKTASGIHIDSDCIFRRADNSIVATPSKIGFHIWTAYLTIASWSQIVNEFLSCKEPSELKTFINQTLGELWEEDVGEKLEYTNLYNRREHYTVPNETIILTAGIDTQDDRFEIQIDAWGIKEERWSIDYLRLFGDLDKPIIWNKLAEVLRKTYSKEDGTLLNIKIVCQDHGGHYADEVNAFSKKMGRYFLIPIKGSSTLGNPVATWPRKKNKHGVYLTMIGTDSAKDILYNRLKKMEKGPGYWHFPVSEKFDETYFKQLTNEKRVKKYVSGGTKIVWDAENRPNEAWDCSVYSLAAVRIAQQAFGINLNPEKVVAPIKQRGSRSRGI